MLPATAIVIISFFIFLAANPNFTGNSIKRGLGFCVTVVIPSMFPFMILSTLTVSSGVAVALGNIIKRPVSTLFGLNGACAIAILLGALSGFPVGAKCALSLYRSSLCSKDEAERVLAFCNNAGPSFVIAGIGMSIFGDLKLGIALYVIELTAAYIVAQLMRPHKTERNNIESSARVEVFLPSAIAGAVTDSALSMLNICAFIVFFAVVCDTVITICSTVGMPSVLSALLSSILEITSGERAAASLGTIGFVIGGAALGWSGLSVHFQVLSILHGSGLSYMRYFAGKTLQSVICALMCTLYALFFIK